VVITDGESWPAHLRISFGHWIWDKTDSKWTESDGKSRESATTDPHLATAAWLEGAIANLVSLPAPEIGQTGREKDRK
jgi:hypothetical protein